MLPDEIGLDRKKKNYVDKLSNMEIDNKLDFK